MKKLLYLTLVLLLGAVYSCKEEGVDLSDLPEQVSSFISKYYPGVEVNRWTNQGGKSTVYLRNSAIISFDNTENKNWASINGNGNTLPQMLVYDQTPVALYRYLEELEAVNGVYKMVRDSKQYELTLFDANVVYNIATGDITQKLPR